MGTPSKPATLSEKSYRRSISDLSRRDAALAAVVSKWGTPPFWTHTPGFPGLVIGILSQQVSLESARAAYTKLEKAIGPVRPQAFLSLGDEALRTIGFSRQKGTYVRDLAYAILNGDVDLNAMVRMDNDRARTYLMQRRGIGAWTADTYLLFALRRPDVWPSGDLALEKAIQEVKGLTKTPGSKEADQIAKQWRPLRAVAARVLWYHYLCERGRPV